MMDINGKMKSIGDWSLTGFEYRQDNGQLLGVRIFYSSLREVSIIGTAAGC